MQKLPVCVAYDDMYLFTVFYRFFVDFMTMASDL